MSNKKKNETTSYAPYLFNLSAIVKKEKKSERVLIVTAVAAAVPACNSTTNEPNTNTYIERSTSINGGRIRRRRRR